MVDDEAEARDLMVLLLEGTGAATRAAASADAALDALGTWRPDVVLCDIAMPGEDGYSLIRRIRDRDRESDGAPLPAIALTAQARPEDRARALGAGFQVHLPKPIEPADLVAAVAAVVGRGGAI